MLSFATLFFDQEKKVLCHIMKNAIEIFLFGGGGGGGHNSDNELDFALINSPGNLSLSKHILWYFFLAFQVFQSNYMQS